MHRPPTISRRARSVRAALFAALSRMLVPFARFALRNAFKFQEFVEAAKGAFIRASEEELAARGEAESVSKISVISGLQRKEVQRLQEEAPDEPQRASLIAKLLFEWSRKSSRKRGKGKGLLTFQGRDSEFAELVRSVSADLNHHTVLFELERLNLVERVEGKVRPVQPQYENARDVEQALEMLSKDVDGLVHAVSENISPALDADRKNLHATTFFDNVYVSDEPEVREWILTRGEAFHREVREYLARHDRDVTPRDGERAGALVHVSTFSFFRTPRERGKKGRGEGGK